MHAQGTRADLDPRPRPGGDRTGDCQPHRALHHGVQVGDHRALPTARDERARVGVRAVGEGLRDDGQSGPAGQLQQARARQSEQRQSAAREAHAVDHGRGLRLVPTTRLYRAPCGLT
ncbi:hypothetical protein GCM10010279_51290 [Streptomyces mutabilis]|nr:hypothetical protein GCM10010279_51290 [Streptomyces mutabilis]